MWQACVIYYWLRLIIRDISRDKTRRWIKFPFKKIIVYSGSWELKVTWIKSNNVSFTTDSNDTVAHGLLNHKMPKLYTVVCLIWHSLDCVRAPNLSFNPGTEVGLLSPICPIQWLLLCLNWQWSAPPLPNTPCWPEIKLIGRFISENRAVLHFLTQRHPHSKQKAASHPPC